MAWLNSFFGGSTAAYLIAITVGLVLVLLGLFWVFRKIAGGNSIRGTKNRRPRLGVTEAAIVDDKRRLVLVRRDNVEHLVMIGGASDVLVERNIVRVQPATGAMEPVKTTIAPEEPGEEKSPAQLEKADTREDVPPRGVNELASGAAATAAVVASIENALSNADDVSADDADDAEFTAAVADTLAKDALAADTKAAASKVADAKSADTKAVVAEPAASKAMDTKAVDTKAVDAKAVDPTSAAPKAADTGDKDTLAKDAGSLANGATKTESKTSKTSETAAKAFEKFTEALSKPESKVGLPPEESTPVKAVIPNTKPQEAQKKDEPSEPEDVVIKIESISEPDDVVEKTSSTDKKKEAKAPEVVPPFEVAAAVSHKEPAKPSTVKTIDVRPDDMEDEMQKLLSELAGERRG